MGTALDRLLWAVYDNSHLLYNNSIECGVLTIEISLYYLYLYLHVRVSVFICL